MCDEALSNIRTVRAFAMEEQEVELYTNELEKARVMQENLGTGIGLFQVISELLPHHQGPKQSNKKIFEEN